MSENCDMTMFKTYLKSVEKDLQSGRATEHTYRPAFKSLIESLGDITATNEPKREKCGAPDFIVTNRDITLGYIEAKDIGKPLHDIEHSNQMVRYLKSLNNLILTDYLEFRWYVQGEHRLSSRLASIEKGQKLCLTNENAQQVQELLSAFLSVQIVMLSSPQELATRMAAYARLIHESIERALQDEDQGGTLHHQMEAFRQVLLHTLTPKQFADMYAQSICYGLFAARCNTPGNVEFTRQQAAWQLPKTNPFLRNLFTHIAGPDLDDRIAWAIDDLTNLLRYSDIQAILQDFGKRTRQEDPVVHFYETFLAAYDPKLREMRGVYYTPEPVVSYIVRSVDHLLKDAFKLPQWLADSSKVKIPKPEGKGKIEVHKVQILDPSTGTGTFLYGVMQHIYRFFANNKGLWSSYVSMHLLPRIFGFELLMAPYAVAHLKLGLQLADFGYDFQSNERLRIYLTNTLEEAYEDRNLPLFSHWLAEEANSSGKIKEDAPVMVILGNPPYSYTSVNTGEWISNLTRDYYQIDGEPLGERNPKGLQDDYVKFIRFAQWRIDKTGFGILAFITNHGYLDNPTFRGMRRSLMSTFDDIYVLDLHGNSKKQEVSPDGSKDENVFDIQQGVAIGIFVKRSRARKNPNVYHAHLWGKRESYEVFEDEKRLTGGKYHWLYEHELTTTDWTRLNPQSPRYLFIPQDTQLLQEYEQGWSVKDVFPVNSSCMTTSRDSLVIGIDKQDLIKRFETMATQGEDLEEIRKSLTIKDTSTWKFEEAASKLRTLDNVEEYLIDCLYRPFDRRWLFYHSHFVERPRTKVNVHMLQPNLSLVTTRQTKEAFACLATDKICGQHKIAAVYDRSYFFPLYLYDTSELQTDLYANSELIRKPNILPQFIKTCSEYLGLKFLKDESGDMETIFGPVDIFYYTYALLQSPSYRLRYDEFLRTDFPRIILTRNRTLFLELRNIGEILTQLHLMEQVGAGMPTYPIDGDNLIETIRYTEPSEGHEEGRIWINQTQYFCGVSVETWQFSIGRAQICHKWLSDRKGRSLGYDELMHYQSIVSILSETLKLTKNIDIVIEDNGGWPLK